MFRGCEELKSINLLNFNTQKVTDMSHMFEGCYSLINLLMRFDTRNVTDTSCMFKKCFCLKSIDLSDFDMKNVLHMYCMFNECISLESISLPKFNLANVECIDGMFFNNPDKLQQYIRNKNPGIELKAFKKASEESCSCWYR